MNIIKKFTGMRAFLILWSGQSVSSLGSAMTNYAMIIWVYEQKHTASSIAFLSLFSYLPSIIFSFAAGTITDRWDKKKVLLLNNLFGALGTLAVFMIFSTGNLQIWHLYIVNMLLSLLRAFINPASYVAGSLLTPKEQYVRASGLQTLSSSLIKIATPALATVILAFSGLQILFVIDLISFGIAFSLLLFFIKIPSIPIDKSKKEKSFFKDCLVGLSFLKERKALLKLILLFSFVNLLSYMTGFGILPAMILARSGNNQTVLGMVSSFVGIGMLVGSIIVTMLKPAMSKTRLVFVSLAISFMLADVLWSLGRATWIWVFAAFAGNLPIPIITANMTTIMRINIPTQIQGRVFSTRDTLQYSTIPLGLFLGGILADYVFEPLMRTNSSIQQVLSVVVGTGNGSGMAVMFLITGIVGCLSSLLSLRNPRYKELDL